MSIIDVLFPCTPPEPKGVTFVQKFKDTEPRAKPKRPYYRLNDEQRAQRKIERALREQKRRQMLKQKTVASMLSGAWLEIIAKS